MPTRSAAPTLTVPLQNMPAGLPELNSRVDPEAAARQVRPAADCCDVVRSTRATSQLGARMKLFEMCAMRALLPQHCFCAPTHT